MKLCCNCCDGLYNSFDVHFTSLCDNRCAHCIDTRYAGKGIAKPNPDAILQTLLDNREGFDDVLFLGGEPCLFLDELVHVVSELKRQTLLKVFVTTSAPKTCYDNPSAFCLLMTLLDGINLSVQSHDEADADAIRRTKSSYDRQAFYSQLPYKSKVRINLNLVTPFLSTKESISACLRHYDAMDFDSIKLSEIQHGKDKYVSFEKLFGLTLGSPFSSGCQTYLDMQTILPGFKTPVLLKRSCFMCEETLTASVADAAKAVIQTFVPPKNNYAVVYEDGSLEKGWR